MADLDIPIAPDKRAYNKKKLSLSDPRSLHYEKNQEKIKARNKIRRDAYKLSIKMFIRWLKESPCLDCNTSYPPIVMDFDHVRGEKKFNVSKAWSNGGKIQKILDEIYKCDLVCANCHRIRTYERLGK